MSEKLGPVDIEFYLKNVNIKEESNRIRNDIKGIGTTANDTNAVLKTLGAGLGAYLSFQTIKGLGGELINVTGEFQKYSAVLKNSLGSQKEAADAMAMLTDKAATTPAQLSELADAYVRLVNQGFKPTSGELSKLSDIASATGKGFGQLAEAIIDAQTGEFERLKEFGIRASKEGDKVTFTFKGIQTQVGFTSKEIQQYIVGLGDLNGVSGASAAIMGTLVGQVSNLGDAYSRMINEIGQDNEGLLSGGINSVSYLIANYKEIADILKVLVATYGAYKAAVIATVAWERAKAASAVQAALAGRALTSWEVIHTAVLYKLNAAQKLLNSTIKANPYALALGALTAIIGGLITYSKWTNKASESQKKIAEINKKAGESFAEEKGKIDLLLSSARNQALSDNKRLDAIGKLKEAIPGYNAELSKEGKLINENTKAIEQYLTQLELKIKMTAVQDELSELWKKEREQIKLVDEAEKELAATKKQNATESGVVYGGDIGIAGAAAKFDMTNRVSRQLETAKKELEETRQVITDLKTEYSSAEKGLTDFFNGTSDIDNSKKKGRAYTLKEEIEALKKLQLELSNTADDWSKYDKQIESKQKELDSITGEKKEDKPKKEEKTNKNYLNKVLEETSTFNQKRIALEFRYLQKKKALDKDGATENIAELDKQHKAELDELIAANFKMSESYRWVYDNIEKMGRKSLKEYINRLRSEINAFKGNEEVKLELTKQLAEAEEKLNTYIPDKLRNGADLLREMASLAGNFNDELERSINHVAELANGIANAIGGYYSGDWTQMVSGIVGVVDSIVKMTKGNKENSSEKIEKWIAKLVKIIQLQEKSLQLLTSKEQITAYTSLLNTVEGQIDKVNTKIKHTYTILQNAISVGVKDVDKKALKEYINKNFEELTQDDWNKILSNTSGDIGKSLSSLYDQWLELRKQQQEYINSQNELLTGSTFDSIVSGITSGFEEGYKNIEDFADTFEELMRKAMIQSIQLQYLEQPLQDWYNQFAAANADGLDANEITSLKAAYNAIITGASNYATALETATGVTLGNSAAITNSDNTLTGAYKSMDQETANLLAGINGAILVHVADIATAITGRFNDNLKDAFGSSELQSTFGLGLTTINDSIIKANDYLKQIADNTSQLEEIKLILSKSKGYNTDFIKDRIKGR